MTTVTVTLFSGKHIIMRYILVLLFVGIPPVSYAYLQILLLYTVYFEVYPHPPKHCWVQQ